MSCKETSDRVGGGEEGGFTHFREKRQGMEPKSGGDYEVKYRNGSRKKDGGIRAEKRAKTRETKGRMRAESKGVRILSGKGEWNPDFL